MNQDTQPISGGQKVVNRSAEAAGQNSGWPLAAGVVFCASLVFAVFTARSLYSDGSYYFRRALEAGGWVDIIPCRSYAGYLFDLPLVIAVKLGVTNLAHLQIGFGLGCFLAWPLALWVCHRLAPRQLWLVMLACGAGYLNAAFMAVGEHIVAHAFFWPVAFAILWVRPLTRFAATALLFFSFILMRSYESMLFLGPLLAALAIWRGAAGGEKMWSRAVLFISAAMLVASAYIGWDGIRHPYTVTGLGSFRTGIMNQLAFPDWTIRWCYGWVILLVASLLPWVKKMLARPAAHLFLAGMVLLWGAWPLLSPATLNPAGQYEARALDLLVPLALLPVAWLISRRPDWLEPHRRDLVNLSAALLLAQSLWQIAATEQWRGYVKVWQGLLAAHTGVVRLADTPYGKNPAVGGQATQFVWTMDALNLSVELSPPRVKSIIQPAAPLVGELAEQFKLENLPRFERYGVDYSEYTNALVPAAKP